jgi:hypothetical protein
MGPRALPYPNVKRYSINNDGRKMVVRGSPFASRARPNKPDEQGDITMESILLTLKAAEFIALLGAVVVIAGGLAITTLQEFIRGKVRESRAPTSPAM